LESENATSIEYMVDDSFETTQTNIGEHLRTGEFG
jgi:hypothetical protein